MHHSFKKNVAAGCVALLHSRSGCKTIANEFLSFNVGQMCIALQFRKEILDGTYGTKQWNKGKKEKFSSEADQFDKINKNCQALFPAMMKKNKSVRDGRLGGTDGPNHCVVLSPTNASHTHTLCRTAPDPDSKKSRAKE